MGQYFTVATTRMIQVDRKLYIKNTTGSTEMFNAALNTVATYPEYIVSSGSVFTNIAIDWTTDRYIIFANALGNAADSLKGSSYEIERIRQT
jgi:cobalamin biosynthesis protein CbiG